MFRNTRADDISSRSRVRKHDRKSPIPGNLLNQPLCSAFSQHLLDDDLPHILDFVALLNESAEAAVLGGSRRGLHFVPHGARRGAVCIRGDYEHMCIICSACSNLLGTAEGFDTEVP